MKGHSRSLLVLALFALGSLSPVADAGLARLGDPIPATQEELVKKLNHALAVLRAHGDQEAIELTKAGNEKAREIINNARRTRGEFTLTEQQAAYFISEAERKGLIPKQGPAAAQERVPEAEMKQILTATVQRGDRDAKRILHKAERNNGKIEMTAAEEQAIIKEARKPGIIK